MITKKTSILLAFERRHAAGIPFTQRDVRNDANCSASLVSIHSKDFILDIASRLLSEKVETDVDFEKWRKEFLIFRSFLQNTKLRKELFLKWVRIHIDYTYREGRIPAFLELRHLCGSSSALIREALCAWSEELGLQLPYTIKKPGSHKRPIVLAAFEKRQNDGIPFNQRDVANDAECSGTLVSLYCKDYILGVANRLIRENIDTDKDLARWRQEFLVLRAFLNNTPSREELFIKWVRVHIDHIYRAGRLPTYTEVHQLCGSNSVAIRKALEHWSAELGIPLQHADVWKKVTLSKVLQRVDKALYQLPLTCMESGSIGKPFTDKQLRLINNIRSQSLRNTAFFVLAFADSNRPNDMRFFSMLDSIMAELGIHEYQDIDHNTFYESYHARKIIPGHSDGKRVDFLQTYFRLLRRQTDYFRKLTEVQCELLAHFQLIGIQDDHFWRHSILRSVRDQLRVDRRKAKVAVIHTQFYQLREMAERRYILIDRLYKAFNQAVSSARKGAKLPLRIQLTEDIFIPGCSTEVATFNLLLWNGPSLRKAHLQLGDKGYYDKIRPDHPSHELDQFYLSYDNLNKQEGSTARYWFSALLAAGYSDTDQRLKELGISRTTFNILPRASIPHSHSAWSRVLRDHMGIEFIPIDLCMTCSLIGNSAIQIMTKAGARVHEFLQIRLSAKHLVQANLSNDKEIITFYAIPKGRLIEEPFYIDDRCMKTLFSWWKYRTEQAYSFGEIKPGQTLLEKLKPASYLWQLDGLHLNHNEVNAATSFLLFDMPFEESNGSKVKLTAHLLRHSFATEMRALDTPIDILALLMKQRDTSVTEYYSKPTPPMLVDFQRRIFEKRLDLTRTHRRSSGQIKKQLEDAVGKVGALAPVIGGTCTVANACPAAFSCLGCFGNAPDVAKRDQVIDYKRYYESMAESSKNMNLPHEHRKALNILSNCDDILAEMDCIEEANRAEALPLKIQIIAVDGVDK